MQLYLYNFASSKLNPESEKDREVYFSGKFKSKSNNSEYYLRAFNQEWINYGNLNIKNAKLFYSLRDAEYKYYFRTATYRQVIWVYWMFSAFLLILLVLISFFIIILIIKKQIEETRAKLGTFKSLGYSDFSLLMFFISPSIVISLFGFIFAYILTLLLQNQIVNLFATYFNIHFLKFNPVIGESILIFTFVLFIIMSLTLLIAYLVIKESALKLLAGNLAKTNTKVGRGFKYLFKNSNPTIKLHSALLMSSTGKILATFATLFVSISLISSSVIVPIVLQKNKTSNFTGLNYNDVVEFNEPISNNHSTFLKTYNPNKKDNWTYNQENKVTDISEATNSKQKYITSYPLKSNASKTEYIYDTEKIIKDLISNDISSNFDLYKEIAKNNYSNWKNMSLEYLKKLDEVTIPSRDTQGVLYDAIASIIDQWTDYANLVDGVEKIAIKSIKQSIDDNKENVVEISKELQNFYKKYVNALPLNITKKYLNESQNKLNVEEIKKINFDNQLFETSTNSIYSEQNVKTPFKLATKGNNRLFYGYDKNSSDSNAKWNSMVLEFAEKNFEMENKKVFFKEKDINSIDLENVNWTEEEFKTFNTNLILWYWINFESKIGTMLTEATYQQANSVAQQSIKKALLEGTNYNITTNIVPYNKQIDELGTMINGTYFSNSKLQNIKIYGINKGSKAVDLLDKKGNDLSQNLFKRLTDEYKQYTPIVVNATIAEKLNLNAKDVIDISVLKKELVDKENKAISLENVNWTEEEFKTFNTNLILWYWINFESKIGTMLTEATYQQANSVAQQSIKKALLEGTNYNITTNIVPYNKQIDELGTMINGTYFSNSKLQNIKIYGINKGSKAVDLLDKKGNDLSQNLFKRLTDEYKQYTPIVVNATIAEKLNLNAKDVIDISVLKKELVDKENKAISLENVNWTEEEFKTFNTNLILWYWINFESKIGTMLTEATYQQANSVAQQSIKKALLEGTNYNITTNIVPYNKQIDELGTMINGTYFSNSKLQNIKIYGINKGSKAVDLLDKKGNDLSQNLFKRLTDEYKQYTPIVVNATIAEKLNLNAKDVIDISVLKKELVDKENKAISLENVEMGIKSKYNYATQTSNDYISEHKKNYFSYNDSNRSWDSESTISVAKINGYNVASNTLAGISQKTDIQKAADNSEIKKAQTGKNQKFIIVGITQNYGDSKAWVSNDSANKILDYDKVKKYFFNNFFLNEWRDGKALKNFYDESIMDKINKNQWEKFVSYYNNFLLVKWTSEESDKFITGADNPYDEYINMFLKLSDYYDNPNGFKYASKYLWQLFENEYPIFNYKYSIKDDYKDQIINTSRTQPFGDYGTVGMMGKSNLETDETGTSKITYIQGYGENGLKKLDSLKFKRQLLDQVQAIIGVIIYLVTVIALIISISIIIITTVLIIGENTQFIATMKILGYSDKYIMCQIISIYILPIFVMFIFGFITAWFAIGRVMKYISSNYSFAIHYQFLGWDPFAVFSILIVMYLITILISYKQFSKIIAVDSLAISS
ncbi:ABC transporter permease [Spiroplasma endosymbiont of Atherix ibis]|uniref:ABC transporter permease n=1 Tax=Spiroplasma endosymbiont of Atherix ibis TaxID=3066291 RepID=UPI0030CDFC7C